MHWPGRCGGGPKSMRPEEGDQDHARHAQRSSHEARGNTVRAGAVSILHDVTLEIAGGAPTVLLGPDGSGK